MKRKVLCVLSLVAWVLVVCTFLSSKIEEQMTAQVVTVDRAPLGNILPMESLFYNEKGYHLFEMVEGTGWESGLRARELGDQSYSIIDNEGNDGDESDDTQQVSASPSYNARLIQFSSRPLQENELVEEVNGKETADDTYLAIFPEAIQGLNSLPNSFKLESRTDTALLLSVAEAAKPFMEPRVRSQLYQVDELRPYIHPMMAAEMRVYSLSDVEQFMGNVPRLVLLLVMLLFPVGLWAASLIVSRRGKGRGIVLFNVAMTAVDAALVPKALSHIDLPSSLLPTDMIFDIKHYISEFRQVFDTLKTLEGNQLAQSTLQAAKNAQHMVAVILFIGILSAILVIIVEVVIAHHKCKTIETGG